MSATRLTCTVADVNELDALVAERLRSHLEERGLRREDMARAMTELGFRWTGNTVTQVITGRRTLSLLEVAGLCEVLHEPVTALLEPAANLALHEGSVRGSEVAAALSGHGGGWRGRRAYGQRKRVSDEATLTAAVRLDVLREDVLAASYELWGRDLAEERDHRVEAEPGSEEDNARRRQARRGHVTRALMQELRAHFDRIEAEEQA